MPQQRLKGLRDIKTGGAPQPYEELRVGVLPGDAGHAELPQHGTRHGHADHGPLGLRANPSQEGEVVVLLVLDGESKIDGRSVADRKLQI